MYLTLSKNNTQLSFKTSKSHTWREWTLWEDELSNERILGNTTELVEMGGRDYIAQAIFAIFVFLLTGLSIFLV